MGNQMMIREIITLAFCQNSDNFPSLYYYNFDKTQVKLLPNFTSIPFV